MAQHASASENPGGENRLPAQAGFRVIDLFAGAGGTALGLETAGFEHVALSEIDRNAVKTLRRNKPLWNVIEGNIRNIDFRPFAGSVDVVEGGFPCQPFSVAGKRLGLDDARGTLFGEFARAVAEVRPKIAMGENVRGLVSDNHGETLRGMVETLASTGYRVEWRVLRSQYLGVPQRRERLVILAVRNDLDAPILFPREGNDTIPLRDALRGCPESVGQLYSERRRKILDLVPPGGCWRDLPDGIREEYAGVSSGGRNGIARRLSWNEPSPTLTCSPSQKRTERCHPDETRPLTVREYARIQTFPDGWHFEGGVGSQYRQIGNAVPVTLAYRMGLCMAAMLRGEPDYGTTEVAEATAC